MLDERLVVSYQASSTNYNPGNAFTLPFAALSKAGSTAFSVQNNNPFNPASYVAASLTHATDDLTVAPNDSSSVDVGFYSADAETVAGSKPIAIPTARSGPTVYGETKIFSIDATGNLSASYVNIDGTLVPLSFYASDLFGSPLYVRLRIYSPCK